ncbi:MAG: hypothetical protein QXP66_00985 [Candidatus Aenigmatarchaeota archaeon]
MLDKNLNNLSYSGEIHKNIISYGLPKQSENSITKEMHVFLKSYKIPKGHILSLVNAVGAGEFWGSNDRGDYFTEAGLKHDGTDYGYKTFEYYAQAYFRHKTDPEHLIGKVLRSFWNDIIKRIFVLNLIDIKRYESIVGTSPFNDRISVSMGCKVPEEICSICGYVNTRNLSTRCDHLKYMMNHVLPDGRKVYAINLRPKFHDITYTFMPADITSTVLLKVASHEDTKIDKLLIAKKISDYWPSLEKLLSNRPSTAYVLQKSGVVFSPAELNILKNKNIFTSQLLHNDYSTVIDDEILNAIKSRSIFRPFIQKFAHKYFVNQNQQYKIDEYYLNYRKNLLSYDWPCDPVLQKYASNILVNQIDGLPLLILENAFNVDLNPAREVIPYETVDAGLIDNKIIEKLHRHIQI